jgi:acetyl-CoA acyltransferase 1
METNFRLAAINNHFVSEPTSSFNARSVGPKHPDDVVLVAMARTAMTRAKKGPQKDTAPELMLAAVLKDVLQKSKADPKSVQEICIGNVLQPGAGQPTSRMA